MVGKRGQACARLKNELWVVGCNVGWLSQRACTSGNDGYGDDEADKRGPRRKGMSARGQTGNDGDRPGPPHRERGSAWL